MSFSKVLKNPYRIPAAFLAKNAFCARTVPDEIYLRIMYRAIFGKKLDLDKPVTFNEKLQWLKLHDRKPEYVKMVDKFEAKHYVASVLGDEYIIPTLGVWDSFEDIDFSNLPDQFALKCTHDSGGLVICRDKKKLDFKMAQKKITECLHHNFYWSGREWPYKMVKPRIIAEQYMEDTDKPGELTDYKIHCFNGEPKLVQVITDRFSGSGIINDHYTLDWKRLDLVRDHYTVSDQSIPKPPEIDEMLNLARKLCSGTYYVRTDFYIINHRVYFGEITFFPSSGFVPFHPDKWDALWGAWLRLPTDRTEMSTPLAIGSIQK